MGDTMEPMQPVIFTPGRVLFKEGESSPDMYYIYTGHVKVVSRSVELAMIGAGKTVGEMGFFRSKPRTATVFVSIESTVDVYALRITKENWKEFVSEHPEVIFSMATEAFDRIEAANERIVGLEQELAHAKDLIVHKSAPAN